MTKEQQKEFNAINYPASALKWINEATDRAYVDIENRICENCSHSQRIVDNEVFCDYSASFFEYENNGKLGCTRFKDGNF